MRGGARDARVGSGRGGAGWAARAARPVLALDLSRIRVSLAAGGGAAKGGGTRRHGGTAPRRRCPVSRRTGGLFFPFPPHSPALNRRYAPHRPRRGGGDKRTTAAPLRQARVARRPRRPGGGGANLWNGGAVWRDCRSLAPRSPRSRHPNRRHSGAPPRPPRLLGVPFRVRRPCTDGTSVAA